MGRILLVLMTVLGMNAANVPANIGDALKTFGTAGGDVAAAAGGVLGGIGDVTQLGGLNISGTSQASVMGGFGASVKPIFISGKKLDGVFGGAQPINVAKANVSARRNRMIADF